MADDSEAKGLNCSLYVGDLHPLVNDSILQQFFSEIGPLRSARICRDTTSHQSLGYAYVNFRTHEHATNAIENLNYEPILDRPCRIMWAQRDPNLRRSGKYNLFVKNLAKHVTQRQFHDSCELFGTILSAKVAMDEKNNSKGYGFVHFATEEAYNNALQFLDGYAIEGSKKKVYAGPFIPKSERKSLFDPNKFNNCFIKNFGDSLDEPKLERMFKKFGEIISCVIMRDEKQNSKGFGFVCFKNSEDALAACENLNGTEINGNTIFVGKAVRKEKRQEELRKRQEKIREERKSKYDGSVNLYVKNLDSSIDDLALNQTFSKFGEITSAKVMKNEDGKSRGFGFVCFKNADSATKAVTEMHHGMLGSKPLYVAIAQRKEDRQNKLLEIFRNNTQEISNYHFPGMGFYPNPPFMQNQRMLQSTLVGPRARIGSMMPTQMSPNQFPQNQPQINHYNSPITYAQIRNQNNLSRNPQSAMQTPGLPQQIIQANMRSPVPRPTGVNNYTNQSNMINNRMGNFPNNINNQMRTAISSNVQYNLNARNVSMPNISDERKTRIGNKLLPIVSEMYPETASKLTGVLLSMDINTLEKLFEDKEALKAQIEETNARILKHEENSKKEAKKTN